MTGDLNLITWKQAPHIGRATTTLRSKFYRNRQDLSLRIVLHDRIRSAQGERLIRNCKNHMAPGFEIKLAI